MYVCAMRPFQAERVEQPHKLFTGSWHKTTKSKYYGLSKEAFDGQSAFVLLKLPKKRVTVSAAGKAGSSGLRLRANAQRAIDSVQVRVVTLSDANFDGVRGV